MAARIRIKGRKSVRRLLAGEYLVHKGLTLIWEVELHVKVGLDSEGDDVDTWGENGRDDVLGVLGELQERLADVAQTAFRFTQAEAAAEVEAAEAAERVVKNAP